MQYTITRTEDLVSEQSISFDKSGNRYGVCFRYSINGAWNYKSKLFGVMSEALDVYQRFVKMFAEGTHSA